jgi:peptidoglycan hydrolase-like protein with peptidoglycan-binding domain
MKDPIVESLATIRSIESKEVLNEAALAAPAAAVAGKGIGRFIPGVGAALGAYDAYGRAKQGDWAGAGLSAAGGIASLIPGVGTAASIGIAGAQALRDKQRTGSYLPGEDEIAAGVAKDAAAQPTQTAAATPTPPGADPKVLALQKQLIAKGAKIAADGKMGPATQAAMKQFPGTAVAEQNKGNDMSESQRIAELRDRLAQIESHPLVAEISLGGLGAGIKNCGSAVNTGFMNAEYAKVAGMATRGANKGQVVNKAASAGAKTGKALNTTAKVGAGAAVGAGAMAALGGGAATKETDPKKITPPTKVTPPAPAADPAQTPNAGADKADVDALNAMAAELENSQDPADIELLRRYNGIINAINNRTPDDKRTQGEIAASADLKDAGV